MTEKQLKKIEDKMKTLTSVYLIVRYASWCVREYKWTGKWVTSFGRPCPIVLDYDDHNGVYEEYVERPILSVTTGEIMDWTFYENTANKFVELLSGEKDN